MYSLRYLSANTFTSHDVSKTSTFSNPWENRFCESFNGTLRDECLNGEIFYFWKEARIVIEQGREQYNTRRPHSALGYRPLSLLKPLSQPQAVI